MLYIAGKHILNVKIAGKHILNAQNYWQAYPECSTSLESTS
jgi:hypothetical protein